jgi:hypothetical protein
MAVALKTTRRSVQTPLDVRRRAVVVRTVAAVVAAGGLAVALFFAVAPIRMTVHEQVGVVQHTGLDGTGLEATGQTRLESRQVTCVPLLRYDTSSDPNPACGPRVAGRLGVAGAGLAAFLIGSGLWIASGGDRAIGLSGRREWIPARM